MATPMLALYSSPLAHPSHRQDFNKRLRNSGLWVLLLGLLEVLKPHEAGCMTGPATRIAEARAQQGKKDTTVGSPSRRAE
jgi:hypothetical protein